VETLREQVADLWKEGERLRGVIKDAKTAREEAERQGQQEQAQRVAWERVYWHSAMHG